ncbi:hypothetical protein Agub_g8835 [Astrephomene gubernaculifera]|uniref:Guanylate cyclase domain-containing protein n=1 Tax=Astrephomene gubernaculifera TaxID=47775 RepID=A0AAD3DSB4_9CHLO|nr:hypothetical protein Agub_g8835 [Astrephomene gubernaculifera]
MEEQQLSFMSSLRLICLTLLAVFSVCNAATLVATPKRGLLQSTQNNSLICAECILNELTSSNTTLAPLVLTNSSQYELWVERLGALLRSDQQCVAARSNGSESLVLSWAQYPSWVNGAFTEWVWHLKNSTDTAEYYTRVLFEGPEAMPELTELNSSAAMRSYAVDHNAEAVVYSADLSGLSTSYVVAQRNIADYTENVCLDKRNPRGPLHPRTYMLLFYRPDALAALRTALGSSTSVAAAPPDDWEGLLALLQAHAAAVQSSSTSGLPKYGMCVTTEPSCGRLGDVATAIAASVVQSSGTHQGYVFDLTSSSENSATPLVNGTGWRYAYDMLRQLLKYNAPDYVPGSSDTTSSNNYSGKNNTITPGSNCHSVSPEFTSGECLLTLEWDVALLSMTSAVLQKPGALGVAPLPGSRVVVSASTTTTTSGTSSSTATTTTSSSLVPCNRTTCSVSANHDLLFLTAAGQQGAALAAARDAAAACGTSERVRLEAAAVAAVAGAASVTGATVVNRAPYSALFDYYVYINYDVIAMYGLSEPMSRMQLNVASRITKERQARQDAMDAIRRAVLAASSSSSSSSSASIDAVTFTSTPWWSALGDYAGVKSLGSSSYSDKTLSTAVAGALAPYIAFGFDATTTASYFRALWHAVHSPNGAPDIASPAMINWFKWGINRAALLLLPPNAASSEEVAAQLARVFELVNEAHTPATVRATYEESIDVAQTSLVLSPPPSLSSSKKSALSSGAMAGVIIAALVGIVLATMLAVVLVRQRNRHRDLLGRVRAPRAGPDTTLLITDIQSSTTLWEALPVSVMDAALKLHHTTIRRMLAEYDGYETGTEGDSFIVAFADPSSAVAFAVATQEALVLLEWPQQLLTHPEAMPVLVDPLEGEVEHEAGVPGAGGSGFRGAVGSGSIRRTNPAGEDSLASRIASFISSRVRVAAASSTPRRGSATPVTPPPSTPYTPRSGVSSVAIFSAYEDASVCNGVEGSVVVNFGNSQGSVTRARGPPPPPRAERVRWGPPSTVEMAANPASESASGENALFLVASSETKGPVQESTIQLPPASEPVVVPAAVVNDGRISPLVTAAARLHTLLGGGGGGGGNAGSGGGASSAAASGGGGITQRGGGGGGGGGGALKKALIAGHERSPRASTDCNSPIIPPGSASSNGDGLLGSADRWGLALQAVFPTLPANDMPSVVLKGAALKSPRVLIPSSARLGVVAYRGLRVRMGIHTGLDDSACIGFNKVASAFKYHGAFAEAAKATESTAPGGLVVLSSAAFVRLRNTMGGSGEDKLAWQRRSSRRRRGPEPLVVYGGHHLLPEAKKPPPSARRASATGLPPLPPGGLAPGGDVAKSPPSSLLPPPPPAAAATAVQPEGPTAAATEDAAADGLALYAAVPASLVCRLALSPPLVSERVVQLGSLAAPVGTVTVAFMYVVGASTLLTDIPGPAARALEQFQRLACGLLGAAGGYLVEGEEGLLLAAFGAPRAGVEWALDCVAGLKKLHWEDELLSHWLCEEVLSVGVAGTAVEGLEPGNDDSLPPISSRTLGRSLSRMPSMARLGARAATQKVQERGLRIKVGLDCGRASHTLTESSGRLSYRGKVMNRASRVAGKAAAGQVLCTDAVWKGCMRPLLKPSGSISSQYQADEDEDEDDALSNLVGMSLGKVALKGVTLPVELIQCMRG